MFVVVIGVMWTFGILGLLEYEITVLTALIPPLIIVIGIPNCIFLINKYQHEVNKHGNKAKSLQRVITKVGNATLMTNTTTASGFATFVITQSKLLTEFGTVASLSIMAIFVLCLLIIPIIYSFMPMPKEKHLEHLNRQWINRLGDWIEKTVKHKSITIYSFSLILLITSIIGIYQIETTGSLLEDMPKSAEFFKDIERDEMRRIILEESLRIDGRGLSDIRPVDVEATVLPSAHGSAVFQRGETQALAATTLGSKSDEQRVDTLEGEMFKNYMLHYNFPPYCVGETGRVMGVKRREVGHGRLARRGIAACLPSLEEFPYTIRIVSEITESNGSSSMASVCGSSLALMDAGVPIKAPVAGIAMGLVKDVDRFTVLTDILGDEDHLGDMDFKVAGTSKGINALQMDIKIDGITEDIMSIALKQAKDARLNILGQMNQVISEPNAASKNAPKTKVIKIPTDKIRDVIGKGGETIRGIVAQSGASVDVDDDGNVNVFANDTESFEKAVQMVKDVTAVPEVNKVYMGKVAKIVEFGAFVTIMPNQDGLLHISEIAHERVEKVEDHLKEGQELEVKVLGVDRGRIKLSRKVLIDK